MSMQETALTVSLFAAMAALQLGGGTHHFTRVTLDRPEIAGAQLPDLAEFRQQVAATLQELDAAGALEDPEIAAMHDISQAVTAGHE
jgi:hypothetical protein